MCDWVKTRKDLADPGNGPIIAQRHHLGRVGALDRALELLGDGDAGLAKLLDIAFFTAFDRPFKPVDDSSYVGIGIETLRDAVGGSRASVP